MSQIVFKELDEDIYIGYESALKWDENKYFTDYELDEFDEFISFGYTYGLYVDEELIGYGVISSFETLDNKPFVSCIINPEYRSKGFGNLLLKCLELEAKRKLEVQSVVADVDKDNKSSVLLFSKRNFFIKEESNDRFIFEKKLV